MILKVLDKIHKWLKTLIIHLWLSRRMIMQYMKKVMKMGRSRLCGTRFRSIMICVAVISKFHPNVRMAPYWSTRQMSKCVSEATPTHASSKTTEAFGLQSCWILWWLCSLSLRSTTIIYYWNGQVKTPLTNLQGSISTQSWFSAPAG